MKRLAKVFSILTVVVVGLLSFGNPAYAQGVGVCDFFPPLCSFLGLEEDQQLSDAGDLAYTFVESRLNLVLSLIFVAIVLLAVFVIIQAAVKYIRSQGNEEQIQDAQKAIKSVFIGIAMLFVGVLGIVLVAAFFGGLEIFSQQDAGQSGDQGCFINDNGKLQCGDINNP